METLRRDADAHAPLPAHGANLDRLPVAGRRRGDGRLGGFNGRVAFGKPGPASGIMCHLDRESPRVNVGAKDAAQGYLSVLACIVIALLPLRFWLLTRRVGADQGR